MGAPKPCLGFSSRTEAVFALREQGLSTEAIARKIGITANQVISLESSAKRCERRADRSAALMDAALLLPPRLIYALAPHADRRGVKPAMLAFTIIETVIAESMVDAVLDDLGERAA
jgi:hypothetical protein